MAVYLYTFEQPHDILPQQKPLLNFAEKIQREVSLLGGRVIATWIDGEGKYRMAKCKVCFEERRELEEYIRWFYEDGLSPEEIEREIALIETGE